MSNTCIELYNTVVHRAEHGLKTKHAVLPVKLWATLTEEDKKWLKAVIHLTVAPSTSLKEPEFYEAPLS